MSKKPVNLSITSAWEYWIVTVIITKSVSFVHWLFQFSMLMQFTRAI